MKRIQQGMRPSGRVHQPSTRLKAASPAVEIDFKPVARIHLKVLPSGVVRISAPPDTPAEYLDGILEAKKSWIERRLRLFRETRPVEREDTVRTGTATRLLGRQMLVAVEPAPRKRIFRDDRRLVVATPDPDDRAAVDRQFRRWWRKTARTKFRETMDRLYPIVGRRKVPKPELCVRRMQTMWGSCSRDHGRIALNESLLKAPQACIDYVVLHELLHFLHPRHDKAFRAALTVHMPDWRDRRRLLDHEIVQGL